MPSPPATWESYRDAFRMFLRGVTFPTGATRVFCFAIDEHRNVGHASFVVIVKRW